MEKEIKISNIFNFFLNKNIEIRDWRTTVISKQNDYDCYYGVIMSK